MEYEDIKVHKLEHTINGWGAKKVEEFLLKEDVDEWAGEQKIAYEDLEKRLGQTIAELHNRIKELEEKNRGVINKWTKSLKIIGAVKEALEQPEGHR